MKYIEPFVFGRKSMEPFELSKLEKSSGWMILLDNAKVITYDFAKNKPKTTKKKGVVFAAISAVTKVQLRCVCLWTIDHVSFSLGSCFLNRNHDFYVLKLKASCPNVKPNNYSKISSNCIK